MEKLFYPTQQIQSAIKHFTDIHKYELSDAGWEIIRSDNEMYDQKYQSPTFDYFVIQPR